MGDERKVADMTDPMVEDAMVEIQDLTKRFDTAGESRLVLDSVSFGADAGEFVSVIGPSGCGKSTIFNVLAGLESPTAGSVRVGTRATESEPATEVHTAYMPQKDLLFPWRSVLDNTALGLEVQGVGKKEARERARELFPAFGLSGFEDARAVTTVRRHAPASGDAAHRCSGQTCPAARRARSAHWTR